MYRIFGADGKEYGPVSIEQLQQWFREGRVNAQTQILPAEATEWKTLGDLPEFAPAAPVAPPPAGATQLSVEEIAAQDYRIEIGTCISRGWELVKANIGLIVGGTLLVFLAQGAIQTPGTMGRLLVQMGSRHNPAFLMGGVFLSAIGTIAAMLLTGPITAGMYWSYLKLLRGQPVEIGDFFAGFRRGFVNLMLCQLVMSLLLGACILPPIAVLIAGIVLNFGKHMSIGLPLLVIGGVFTAVGIVLVIYLTTCWFYALALTIDRQLGFWQAMQLSKRKVTQHWWQVFGLTFVAGLVGAAGILLCCVGFFVTMPIAIASFMCGYEVIFGRSPTQAA